MKRDWWNKEFRTLVTLGESTTAGGWSSCRERCWASQLTRLINEFQSVPVQLFNVGIGANLLSTKSSFYEVSGKPAATERLDKHVFKHNPDLLMISYGLNDARAGTSIPKFSSEMEHLIRCVRERIQPLIMLLGPYYMNDFTLGQPYFDKGSLDDFYRYNEAIEKIAAKTDCLFVDLMASYSQADWLVHYDGCHANDLGHRIVANKCFEVLASNCSGLSLRTKSLEKSIPPWRDESTLQKDYKH